MSLARESSSTDGAIAARDQKLAELEARMTEVENQFERTSEAARAHVARKQIPPASTSIFGQPVQSVASTYHRLMSYHSDHAVREAPPPRMPNAGYPLSSSSRAPSSFPSPASQSSSSLYRYPEPPTISPTAGSIASREDARNQLFASLRTQAAAYAPLHSNNATQFAGAAPSSAFANQVLHSFPPRNQGSAASSTAVDALSPASTASSSAFSASLSPFYSDNRYLSNLFLIESVDRSPDSTSYAESNGPTFDPRQRQYHQAPYGSNGNRHNTVSSVRTPIESPYDARLPADRFSTYSEHDGGHKRRRQTETPRPQLDLTLPPRSFLAPLSAPLAQSPYTPTSAIVPAFSVGLTSAGVGLFISAIKNSLEPHNKGAMGVFTRTGWIVGYFATAGFVFSFVDHTVANVVESTTSGVSGFSAGCAAGFVSGIRTGSLPKAMGMCAFLGGMVGTYDAAGGQLGWESGKKTREEREADRLKFFKKASLGEQLAEE